MQGAKGQREGFMTEAQPFLYKQLATAIEDQIRNGDLRAGEKLPSLRNLHRKLGLSISTVYQAYTDLEALGLIEAQPKAGFFVKGSGLLNLKAPRPTETPKRPTHVRLSSITNDVLASSLDPSLVPLGCSTLSVELFPHKHLGRIIKGIRPAKMKQLFLYAPAEGDEELRRQLVRRLVGMIPGIGPENLVITNGCMEAVALSLLTLAAPGDVVAVESPTHFGFLQLLKELGLQVLELPTDPVQGMDLDGLGAVLKQAKVKACLLTPNFQNPSGALMPDRQKMALVALLQGRKIPIIEDDIYGELHFGPRRPSLLKAWDKKGLVITCSSFSKTLAPGFRIGWLAAGEQFVDKIRRIKAGVSLASPTLQQYVMAKFLRDGGFDRYLRSLRTALHNQVLQTALAIQKYFPSGSRLAVPEGGNLLWIELPKWADGLELYKQALRSNISIVPGPAFSTTGRYRNYVRISSTTPFSETIEQAIGTLGELINGQKP
jgi:DNA-binding transcriptional MocR family regulator